MQVVASGWRAAPVPSAKPVPSWALTYGSSAKVNEEAIDVLDKMAMSPLINADSSYMRFAVTRLPEALQAASLHLQGLVLLHNITGSEGFPARSVCAPDELRDVPRRCGGGLGLQSCDSPHFRECSSRT